MPTERMTIRLPVTPFFYTLDQIALLLGWSEKKLRPRVFLVGRSSGTPQRQQMQAVNMAAPRAAADWRISEREFVRWLRYHNYVITKEC